MIPWFTNFAIYLNKQAVFSMQKPLALIDSFVFVRCNLFQWFGSQFVLVAQRIRINNRKMWLLWRAIGYFFLDYVSHHRFSIVIHNTVILVALPDSWAIHWRNTEHDLKKIFSSMRKFTLCNEGWRWWWRVIFAQHMTNTRVLYTIRSENPRHTTTSVKCRDLLFFWWTFNFDSTWINFLL